MRQHQPRFFVYISSMGSICAVGLYQREIKKGTGGMPAPVSYRCVHTEYLMPYGRGMLMCVFTIVTDAVRVSALPFSVTILLLPAVENEIAV